MMDERGGSYLLWRISTLKLEIVQTNHSGRTHRTVGPDEFRQHRTILTIRHITLAAQDYIATRHITLAA
jgi:hypothetical protein